MPSRNTRDDQQRHAPLMPCARRGVVAAQVGGQHHVAEESRKVVEHRRVVPETFAEQLRENEVHIGDAQSEGPKREITLHSAARSRLDPRRDNRSEQVESQQHIDEPEVSDLDTEIDRDAADAEQRSGGIGPSRQELVDCVEHAPHQKRHHNAHETPGEKVARALPHRKQEKSRQHDEQRHGGAAQRVEPAGPDRFAARGDQAAVGNIVEFSGVHLKHHVTGQHTQQVETVVSGLKFRHKSQAVLISQTKVTKKPGIRSPALHPVKKTLLRQRPTVPVPWR